MQLCLYSDVSHVSPFVLWWFPLFLEVIVWVFFTSRYLTDCFYSFISSFLSYSTFFFCEFFDFSLFVIYLCHSSNYFFIFGILRWFIFGTSTFYVYILTFKITFRSSHLNQYVLFSCHLHFCPVNFNRSIFLSFFKNFSYISGYFVVVCLNMKCLHCLPLLCFSPRLSNKFLHYQPLRSLKPFLYL